MSFSEEFAVLILHGPNMNLVGHRSSEAFGTLTLDKIDRGLRRTARSLNTVLKIYQSNDEGPLVKWLQRQRNWADGILLNPTTLCFTSYTILDTLQLIKLPAVEIHLTESIAGRSVDDSLLKPTCVDSVIGPPDKAYEKGLHLLVEFLKEEHRAR